MAEYVSTSTPEEEAILIDTDLPDTSIWCGKVIQRRYTCSSTPIDEFELIEMEHDNVPEPDEMLTLRKAIFSKDKEALKIVEGYFVRYSKMLSWAGYDLYVLEKEIYRCVISLLICGKYEIEEEMRRNIKSPALELFYKFLYSSAILSKQIDRVYAEFNENIKTAESKFRKQTARVNSQNLDSCVYEIYNGG